MNTIWHIFLTACLDTQMLQCATQDVQWFDTKEQCEIALEEYTEIPQDGDFKTIEWQCKPLHSTGT